MQEEKELDPRMGLGTCGLHLVHSSMKAGAKASQWELQKLLKEPCDNSYMMHLRDEQCTRTYQNQQIFQAIFVVTAGVRTKSLLKRQNR